jgi:hypothetical protein
MLPKRSRTAGKAPKRAGGHECKYEGRLLNDGRVEEIIDWPLICRNPTENQGILENLKPIIRNVSIQAKPTVQLTRKDVRFELPKDHLLSTEKPKHFVKSCKTIRTRDYSSKNQVLAMDSLWRAGFVRSRLGDDKKGCL